MKVKKMTWRIRETSFDQVLPYWQDQLWPKRQSPIEPFSIISHEGNLELNKDEIHPHFWIAEAHLVGGPKCIGVISGFQTSDTHFRCRGVWVEESYRRRGIGKSLLESVGMAMQKSSCSTLWSMARAKSLSFYLKNGFRAVKEVRGYEFGPHFIVEAVTPPLPMALR